MISRLTFCAALFAAIATVGLAYAAESAQGSETPSAAASAPAVVVMPTVEVTGKRSR